MPFVSPLHVSNPVVSIPLTVRQPLFEDRGPHWAAAAVDQPMSLADRLSHGDLGAREVLRYATDMAANLAERHRRGAAHGAIAAEAVVLAGGSAQLQDPRGKGATPAEDAVQFAALLRVMARAAVAEERLALGAALGALSGQYLTAPGGANAQTFKKLVLALKVLRLEYRGRKPAAGELLDAAPERTEMVSRADTATAVQAAAEAPAHRRRTIRLLIRAVPAAPVRNRRPAPRGFFRRILSSPFLG